jgi:hypothetical protein
MDASARAFALAAVATALPVDARIPAATLCAVPATLSMNADPLASTKLAIAFLLAMLAVCSAPAKFAPRKLPAVGTNSTTLAFFAKVAFLAMDAHFFLPIFRCLSLGNTLFGLCSLLLPFVGDIAAALLPAVALGRRAHCYCFS